MGNTEAAGVANVGEDDLVAAVAAVLLGGDQCHDAVVELSQPFYWCPTWAGATRHCVWDHSLLVLVLGLRVIARRWGVRETGDCAMGNGETEPIARSPRGGIANITDAGWACTAGAATATAAAAIGVTYAPCA
eukprot:CAMPEP_0206297650 /NCGR_PEP_ID=MMETSP0106_2-20121207/6279_1 /ASSEMBLY_ACC=CAM_ASM_000206 /TAXON_ID=81532 /ORGANISM="Acanthoeca-like sp., Strain 10tr" /LENGTH=132 /DNA_ID=CAMNT_0053728317 /DNA_START=160 /DNA_END=559 /DNA_ORIENTATION=-